MCSEVHGGSVKNIPSYRENRCYQTHRRIPQNQSLGAMPSVSKHRNDEDGLATSTCTAGSLQHRRKSDDKPCQRHRHPPPGPPSVANIVCNTPRVSGVESNHTLRLAEKRFIGSYPQLFVVVGVAVGNAFVYERGLWRGMGGLTLVFPDMSAVPRRRPRLKNRPIADPVASLVNSESLHMEEVWGIITLGCREAVS